MASIRLDSVTKLFDKNSKALSDVSIQIEDGELMVLVGPSGCGKSTLLRSIAGLEFATSGEIFIGDTCVNTLAPHKRNVAMVFQSYALYPNLSVFENIAFPLRAIRTNQQAVKQQVTEVATRLGLESYLTRKPRELSGGQRQRVAIARAIIRNPQAFLMDEPLSNLDAKLRHQMRAEIMRLQRQLGTTTVFVTHDQVEAMTMGDRITVMNAGEVQQIGTPYEVYNRPANTFVASFIGAPPMNLVPVLLSFTQETKQETSHVTLVEDVLQVPSSMGNIPRDGRFILGIRPEDLKLTHPGDAMVSGSIDLVEYTGSETILTALIGNSQWTVKVNDRRPFGIHEEVHLRTELSRIYLFDYESKELQGTLEEFLQAKVPVHLGGR
jgi:multiple sugar transport system ATP-binding protein